VRVDPRDGLLPLDQPLGRHVDSGLQRGGGGPLRGARLQQIEASLLDRELDVLDVAVVLLEPGHRLEQLIVRLREPLPHLLDRLRRPDAGDDVLSLGVHQVLAVDALLAGRGVAREADPRGGAVALVPEDHLHDVDGGAEVVRDPVRAPVDLRARVAPRFEDRDDRAPKRLPVFSSSRAMCSAISSSRPSGTSPSPRMYARDASVAIVKPAGTGTPSCVISARPTPLPPRSFRPPSEGSSKAYTYRVMTADLVIDTTMDSPQIVGIGGFPNEVMCEDGFGLAPGRRVLFVGTASMEDPPLAVSMYESLRPHGEVWFLRFNPWPPEDLRGFALSHDVIFVGGGNTANMLAVWRVHGFDRILREAWESGIVLTGWSAGMICWFEAAVTDSFGPQLEGMR